MSVRLHGALTWVGRVRWMGCGVPRCPRARASLFRRVRLRAAVSAGLQGGGGAMAALITTIISASTIALTTSNRQMRTLDGADDLQFLRGGISHSSYPLPVILFFEQAVLKRQVGHAFLQR